MCTACKYYGKTSYSMYHAENDWQYIKQNVKNRYLLKKKRVVILGRQVIFFPLGFLVQYGFFDNVYVYITKA